jgi:phage terminase small subunit
MANRLSPREFRFVEYYSSGKMTAKEAYLKAGYKNTLSTTSASQLLQKPRIRQAIDDRLAEFRKTMEDKIIGNAEDALDNELFLMTSAESEMVRLRASQDVLDRAGFKAKDKVEHSGSVDLTWRDIIYGTDQNDKERESNQ